MVSNWRVLIVSLVLPMMLIFTACSNGGGGHKSSDDSNKTVSVIDANNTKDVNKTKKVDDEDNSTVTQAAQRKSSFGLVLKNSDNSNLKVFDYKLRIERNGKDLMQRMSDYVTSVRNSDGSINIIFTKDTTTKDGVVQEVKGISGLENGDVVTFSATGFTPQQFTITQDMLVNASVQLALKAVSSRQTFNLADLLGNADAVQPRSTFGASVNEVGNDIVITTHDKRASLTFSKENFQRVSRKISRLPRSSTDTQVYLDMTPIDPVTEHEATIGDFTYDPTAEPRSSRSFRATRATDGSEDYGLESVTMADIQMSTSEGDKIDCFAGGDYDEESATCNDDGEATLKMQVPESQFDAYARKYNAGDRVVPLYSYNDAKATWVRQLDADGNGKDGELVLEDNNANQKADEGDTLYIEGKVTHFSWWNGDYAYNRTCLNVFVDETNSTSVSRVHVKGVDYTGREFDSYLSGDEAGEQVNALSAKANSIVEVSLIMKSGEIGDSLVVTTGDEGTECIDAGTLYAPTLHDTNLTINVEDTDGNKLENASVNFNYNYKNTDENGQVSYDVAVKERVVGTVNVSYNNDGFYVSDSVELNTTNTTNPTETIVLDIRKQVLIGRVKEAVNGQAAQLIEGAYVEIYANDYSYYQYAQTDVNGNFEITLPKSKIIDSPEARIYIYAYNSEYSYYPYKSEELKLDENSSNLGDFTLSFSAMKINGRVINTNNEGIRNAYVSSSNFYRYAYTDAQGFYNMTIIADGDNANLDDTIYVYDYKSSKSASKEITLAAEKEVNFEIDQRQATITGKVITDKGIPLSGIYVYYSKDYSSVLTDVNGSFELKTYYDGNASLYLYDTSTYSYLQVQGVGTTLPAQNVELGAIKEMGNIVVESANFAPIIESVTVNPTTPLQEQDFYINVDAYDPDGDALTYDIEQQYVYGNKATIYRDANSFTVNVDASSYVYFNIIVTDARGKKTTRFISLYVKEHAKPVIESINGVDYNWDISADMNVSVSAYSTEGNALTYSFELVNLDGSTAPTLSANENNVTLSKDIITNGRYRLNVIAEDAYGSTSSVRYFLADNTKAPKIDSVIVSGDINQTISNGNILYLKVGDEVAFRSTIKDEALVIGEEYRWSMFGTTYSTQDVESQTLDREGFFYASLNVRDKIGRSDSRFFYISVAENQVPVVNSITMTPSLITKKVNRFVDANENNVSDLTINVDANDPEGENLTYTFGNIDSDGNSAEVNGSKAKYVLEGLEAGRHSIKVTISDGVKSVERYTTFDVLKNQAPIMTKFIVPANVKKGDTVSLSSSAEDPNGDNVTYSWSASSEIVTLTNADKKDAALTAKSEGNVTITLVVSDGDLSITRRVKMSINANQTPIIKVARISSEIVKQKGNLDLYVDANDVDGKIKSIEWKLDDKSLSSQAQERVVISDDIKVGDYNLVVTVTDDEGASVSEEFSLSVEKPNAAPVITSFTASKKAVLIGEEVELNVAASDADGDELTVIWLQNTNQHVDIAVGGTNPDRATFVADEAGTYDVFVKVTDGANESPVKKLTIDVSAVTLSVSANKTSAEVGSDFTFTASFSDGTVVPTDVTWSIEAKPNASTTTLQSDGATTILRADVSGTYRVKARVTLFDKVYEASFSVAASSTTEAPDLEGTVSDSEGNALAGAQLRLYNAESSDLFDVTTTSDSEAHYEFYGVPAGTYYLVVYAGESAISQTQVITIGE